ncbi:MAG: hypothetical protein NTV75_06580 [Bacteroidia bacterium]|nr:hypothetical protein [Bacteroidia bacterium]
MKKLMLGVILFTLVFSSCKKYDNDFAALKDQIAALATQVAGVSALQTQLTATTAQVTALQTAVGTQATTSNASLAALATSLGTATTNIATIQTSLNTLATAGTANKAVVDQLKLDLAALATSVAANNTALNTKVDANNTAAIAANAATLVKIAAAQTSLDNITTFEGTLATTAVVAALQVKLDAQKAQLTQIINNTSMYTGPVNITTDTEVDFFTAKIAQMPIINGTLNVNPALITKLADMNLILSKITAVIGATTITGNATVAKALNLSNLTSVSGALTVNGGNLITQAAVDISKLAVVTGAFTYSLDGPISMPLLANVGGLLAITPYTTAAGTVVGTTSVNLPLVAVAGTINANSVTFDSATSVIMPATGVTVLHATAATTVTVVNTLVAAAGLTVTPKTTGSTVDLSSFTSAAGALTVATCLTANLSNLATAAGAVSITTVATGTVNLDKFNSDVSVTIEGAKTVSLPVWVGGAASTLIAVNAETISLPVHTWSWGTTPTAGNWAAVKTLTVGNLNAPVTLAPYTTLVTASITGKTVTTWATLLATVTTTNANAALKTITLGGMLKSASITDAVAEVIESITTSGVINSFLLEGADKLTSLTLGHTAFTSIADGTPGSILSVKNCILLASLTATNLDKIVGLTIESNALLTAWSFPALVNLANVGVGTAITVSVKANKIGGVFTAASAGPPYAEAIIASAQLLKLKPYLILATGAGGYATKTYNLVFDRDGAGAVYDLVAAMNANDVVSAAIDNSPIVAGVGTATTGINVATELVIIQ